MFDCRGDRMTAEILQFRTKRLTGFIAEDERRPVGEASNRAFWIGPEQTNTKLFETADEPSPA
jgi:hypothetical protein